MKRSNILSAAIIVVLSVFALGNVVSAESNYATKKFVKNQVSQSLTVARLSVVKGLYSFYESTGILWNNKKTGCKNESDRGKMILAEAIGESSFSGETVRSDRFLICVYRGDELQWKEIELNDPGE